MVSEGKIVKPRPAFTIATGEVTLWTAISGKVIAIGSTPPSASSGPAGLSAAQLTYGKLQVEDWWREHTA